jgi:hypothetical protein
MRAWMRRGFGGDERGQGQRQGDDGEPEGGDIAVRLLGQGVDRDRDRAGLTGDIADEDDGGAELAQAAGEGEHTAHQYARQGEWHGDGEEDAQWAGAQGARGSLQLAVHGLQREPDGLDHQGKAHDRRRQGRTLPGEDQGDAQMVMEPGPRRAAPPEEQQQPIADHHRRHDQRQMHQAFEQGLARKPPPREQPGDRDAEGQAGGDADQGHAQAERDRLPFGLGQLRQ